MTTKQIVGRGALIVGVGYLVLNFIVGPMMGWGVYSDDYHGYYCASGSSAYHAPSLVSMNNLEGQGYACTDWDVGRHGQPPTYESEGNILTDSLGDIACGRKSC